MSEEPVIIRANNISVKFNLNREKVYSLKEYLVRLFKGGLHYDKFWALKDVSFDVKRGEMLGIVGLNGAGKSTLLRVIAGILKPSAGEISVRGTIAPLIELGAGFDMELTARDNVYLNGAFLGYDRKTMNKKFDEIIHFAEVEEFVNVPLKNFSSGMQARLGFSIATIVHPDVLLVDEVLAVGDFRFQEKCEKRIREMIDRGTTVVLVSHSITQVEKLCSMVLFLENHRVKMFGPAKEVCAAYKQSGQ